MQYKKQSQQIRMQTRQSEYLAYATIGWLGLILFYDILVVICTMLNVLMIMIEHVTIFLFQMLIALFIYQLFVVIYIRCSHNDRNNPTNIEGGERTLVRRPDIPDDRTAITFQ
jgi:hypothetical protein